METALLFCNSYFEPNRPNEFFLDEFIAAKKNGFQIFLFDEHLLSSGDIINSIKKIPPAEFPLDIIYRGWMLEKNNYFQLQQELVQKNMFLINNLDQYLNAHYFPRAYPFIEKNSAKAVWFPLETNLLDITEKLAAEFGDSPLIIKDYVKSQKHFWAEAFFIPSAKDANKIKQITKKFLELQDGNLTEGLVYRQFIPFKKNGLHPQSGMPIAKEIRVFIYRKKVLLVDNYWNNFPFHYSTQKLEQIISPLAESFPSNFFTVDLGVKEDGEWAVIETGDGQVLSIPSENYLDFYQKLKEHLNQM